ncbi:MAG TPA: type I DNA topoisomerase [Spirochaetota bacterium]|nr:type I DNA topoisomerase [Spirochaetota bacterium]HNT10474.1 type I DNA topoisomerase [Spirochaetota bacterium]HPU87036.1 type I DNA topoisomerase [Spirochaetota bacterium]
MSNSKEGKTLVIVESPAKAKTINKYLGSSYTILSSMGHIIDLPKSRLAVDIDNDFVPEYITIRGRAKILNELKKNAAKSSRVLLATDPDREGEAISWHLANALTPKNANIQRIEFNEITEHAVKEAVQHPRSIDVNLVNAQQARRILDRIVGYYISPILWRKVKKGLSAGRVQSVALKVICDRETEIESFIPEEYWTLDAHYTHKHKAFTGSLSAFRGEKIKPRSRETVDEILAHLEGKRHVVRAVDRKERRRNPQPPYITSKLQQDASNRLGFNSYKTMMVAQQLYEGVELTGEGSVGLITYMRTDSTRISDLALSAVRDYIGRTFEPDYLPEQPNTYRNKKGSQDAHEAIRPTDVNRTPESIREDLSAEQFKVYDLIWRRFVSSQMTPEVSNVVTVIIDAGEVEFRASGSTTIFKGFAAVEKEDKTKKMQVPEFAPGDEPALKEYAPEQHFTSPPPRYNDASLVKFLEESGIGRPSTYAPTINTLIKRYYVTRSGRQLVPTVLGRLINTIMSKHFPTLVSIDFTANMEEKLDLIEESKSDWKSMLRSFHGPFKEVVDTAADAIEEMKSILDEPTDLICEKCGRNMVKKLGKYGFFLACPGFPECRNSKTLPLGKCPVDGCDGDIVKKSSKKGRAFYGCSKYPACVFITNDEPSDKHCPKCGGLLFKKRVKGKGEMLTCQNVECDYRVELLDDATAAKNGDENDAAAEA